MQMTRVWFEAGRITGCLGITPTSGGFPTVSSTTAGWTRIDCVLLNRGLQSLAIAILNFRHLPPKALYDLCQKQTRDSNVYPHAVLDGAP